MISPYILPGVKPDMANLTPDVIVESVCSYFGITERQLKNRGKRNISYARSIAMYLIRRNIPIINRRYVNQTMIAEMFYPAISKGDHTAVGYAEKMVEKWIVKNPKTKNDVDKIKTLSFYKKLKYQ